MKKTITLCTSFVLLTVALGGCQEAAEERVPAPPPTESTVGQPDPTGPLKEYAIKGEIVSVDRNARSALIKHDTIEGFMGAMTMAFPVPEESELAKIEAGDHITATVYQRPSDSRFWVGSIQVQE